MNWAWQQRLAPAPKLILMALADAADDEGICWPSVAKVSSKCCVSERTVQRVIQEFVAHDLLQVTRRFSSTGRQKSNGYLLKMNARSYLDKLSPSPAAQEYEGDNLSGRGATSDVGDEGDTVLSPLEPPEKSSEQPQPPHPPMQACSALHFPRLLSTEERAAAASIVSGIDSVTAQALLDELCSAIESKSIRTNSIRWLRALAQRHHKGQFEPTGALQVAARRARSDTFVAAEGKRSTPSSKAVALAAIAAARAALAKGKEPHDC